MSESLPAGGGASSSSSHCMNAIEQAAKRMTACSIAIPIAPIC